MLRRLFDPKPADNDSPYKERAVIVAARFAQALDSKRYSEIWHELVSHETKEIAAALVYLQGREDAASSFGIPVEEATQEFLSYVLDNDIERTRTGLWAGIRGTSKKYGWLSGNFDEAQVAFMGDAAVVSVPSRRTPLLVPLLTVPGEGYRVDLETFVVASRTLGVREFVEAAQRASTEGDFDRAIRLLEDALRLGRAHRLLRQHTWQEAFTLERRAELEADAAFLARVEPQLAENRELAALDVDAALRRDEDESVDFKREIPPAGNNDARKKLAREFAAFATEGGGTIYFGVTDAKDVVGVPEAETSNGRDEFRKRIDNMCRDNVKPAIEARVRFLSYVKPTGSVVVPAIVVPAGSEPVYYVDHRPYVRRGQSARLAEPHEVTALHRDRFLRLGWKPPN
jgi:hypothetical protein